MLFLKYVVFTVLRQALGVSATPRVFMSDMAENFYVVWSDVMGPVEFRLFCSWHVLRFSTIRSQLSF
jgi:hypothetical protein